MSLRAPAHPSAPDCQISRHRVGLLYTFRPARLLPRKSGFCATVTRSAHSAPRTSALRIFPAGNRSPMKTILASLASLILMAAPASAVLIPVHWGFRFDGPPGGHIGHFFADQAPDGTISNVHNGYVHNYAAYTLTAFSASSDFTLDLMQAEMSFTLESVDDTIQFAIVDGAWTETRTNPAVSRSGQATGYYLFLPEGGAGLPLLSVLLGVVALARRRLT